MENTSQENTNKKYQSPSILTKIFYNKSIFKKILQFLKPDSALKKCFSKPGWKDKKKLLKDKIKKYIQDFGKHQEKVKYWINNDGILIISTSIFNINKTLYKTFTHVVHKETSDIIELEKEDFYSYLKVLPKFDFYLTNTKGICIKLCKALIPFDTPDEQLGEDEDPSKKYELFYNFQEISEDLSKIDFSDKDYLVQRQRLILEKINAEKNKIFYPLEFISSVNYWSIILCHGGYFACGFFLKDKIIDHKSDHKYVVRKKAGQRQIVKDQSKKIKSSGKKIYVKYT